MTYCLSNKGHLNKNKYPKYQTILVRLARVAGAVISLFLVTSQVGFEVSTGGEGYFRRVVSFGRGGVVTYGLYFHSRRGQPACFRFSVSENDKKSGRAKEKRARSSQLTENLDKVVLKSWGNNGGITKKEHSCKGKLAIDIFIIKKKISCTTSCRKTVLHGKCNRKRERVHIENSPPPPPPKTL